MNDILKYSGPFGVTITVTTSAVVSYLLVSPLIILLSSLWLDLTVPQAIVGGLVAAFLIYPADLLHQLGHAWAAHRVGYPMKRIILFSPLAYTIYPKDEPELPRSIHAKRALGGFWVNVLIGLLLLPLAIYLWPRGDTLSWIVAFTAAYNLLILGFGVFVPIHIPSINFSSDGGTLLRLWREQQAQEREE